MWQLEQPIFLGDGPLSPLGAWVYVFTTTWETLEPNPEDLDQQNFHAFAYEVARRHGDEDPEVVAKRLFPEAGEFADDFYLSRRADMERQVPLPFPIADSDVPF